MKKLLFLFYMIYLSINSQIILSETLDERVEDILNQMTIDEKIIQLHNEMFFTTANNARLGIPGFVMDDGPHGVRMELATCFPVGIAMAATWDTAMIEQVGIAMGEEFNGFGKNQQLGPAIDLCRDPRNGRSPESGGEDPYLCGQIGLAVTKGIQSTPTFATVKHFNCKNKQEYRHTSDVIITDRWLMGHYGYNFRTVVQGAGALSVMSAYNLINGEKSAQNPHLLTTILKEDWGFPFYIVSDWGGVWDAELAIEAGNDVCMGSDNYENELPGLYTSGDVTEETINIAVRRVLRTKLVSGMLGGTLPFGSEDEYINTPAHQQTCLDAGRKSIVLLKNTDNILPLSTSINKVALIGPSANEAQLDGFGSSVVTPPYAITPRQGIEAKIGASKVVYAYGCDINSTSTTGFAAATTAASQADVVIYVGGLDETQEGEGYDIGGDRKSGSVALPGKQQDLINALAAVNPNIIVVLESGGICSVNSCITNIKGFLYAFYPGQEGGNAIADVIFGDYNPGGKLPVTMPIDDSQIPPENDDFTDDYGCGYRWYDEMNLTPEFVFGYGLSYTTFQYSNLVISPSTASLGEIISVSVDIKNTGAVIGEEVAQLYVTDDESSLWKPEKELKGFKRISLEPNEKKTVTFTLSPDELYDYDEIAGRYIVEAGSFTLRVGGASNNLPLSDTLQINSAAEKPDLQIANIYSVPKYPLRGDDVIFLATVRNLGTGPSPAGEIHRVLYRVNGVEKSWSTELSESIPVGGMALICANEGVADVNTWTPNIVGTYTIEVQIDPNDTIDETIETNNTKSKQLTVSAPSDNLAYLKPVVVSSTEDTEYAGSNAVDMNMSSRWSSLFSDPQWIYVDLGDTYYITSVVLKWEDAYGSAYKVQTAENSSGPWTDIYSTTTSNGGTDDLAVSGSGRYVRVYCTTRATEWGYSLWEFEVYGTNSSSFNINNWIKY